jgi:hypothetical protein
VNEVKCVQDYAMHISMGLVAEEQMVLKLSQLHWLKV